MANIVEGTPFSIRPLTFGSRGHYRTARRYIPIASQPIGIVWALRNPVKNTIMVVFDIRLRVLQVSAPSAPTEVAFAVHLMRNYTTTDAGGVSITPAPGQQKLRGIMGDSVIEFNEGTTSLLRGGVGIQDASPIALGSMIVPGTFDAKQETVEVLKFLPSASDGEYPVTLEQNEGLRVRCSTGFGAVPGIVILADFGWAEVTPPNY